MAVIATNNPTGLKIKFNLGKDLETGSDIIKSKTFSNVKSDALDQDLFDVGSVIASLQTGAVVEICRIDNTTLSE